MRLYQFMVVVLLTGSSYCAIANDWVQAKSESFTDYRKRMSLFMTDNKAWVTPSDRALEVDAVLPYEYLPGPHCQNTSVGVLMFHGLSDSPFVLRDSAKALSDLCLHARVMILPGHGTKAEDLLDVSRQDWRLAVANAAAQFAEQVDAVYLAGFSTGGALVTEYAWQHAEEIEGVVLFSPLFKINSSIDWLSPLLSPLVDWLDYHASDDYAKYASIPVPAIAEAYKLAKEVKALVMQSPAQVPVFVALSEEDATVDSTVTLTVFNESFKAQPKSKLVLYSATQKTANTGQMGIINTDLPEQRILGLSHMAIHGAPQNPYYGVQGEYRVCSWYLGEEDRYQECRQAESNWYGERSDALSALSDVPARLSWNPYFDDLMVRVAAFIAETRDNKEE